MDNMERRVIRGVLFGLTLLVLTSCGVSGNREGQSVSESNVETSVVEGGNIFIKSGLSVPATFFTYPVTDDRVATYCGNFRRAAYYGSSKGRGVKQMGIFIQRVYPEENNRCVIFGAFSVTAINLPQKIYPFRADFDGNIAQVVTVNMLGVGQKRRIRHTMQIEDDNMLLYQAKYFGDNTDLFDATLREIKVEEKK